MGDVGVGRRRDRCRCKSWNGGVYICEGMRVGMVWV